MPITFDEVHGEVAPSPSGQGEQAPSPPARDKPPDARALEEQMERRAQMKSRLMAD